MTAQTVRIDKLLKSTSRDSIRRFQGRLFQVLTSATPVDTGFARASLTPSVGSPLLNEVARPASASKAKSEASSRLAENKTRAAVIATTYQLAQGSIFFTYRAGYVQYLNEGSSAQAPTNFIEQAIAIASRGF